MGLQSEFDQLLDSADPLSGLDDLVWEHLSAGARSHEHPWWLSSISTIEHASGNDILPHSRTVVVRHADANARLIECHTDARSGKVTQLNRGAEASWLFYDHQTRIQLRLNGRTHVINDDEADRAWRATPLRSRAAYLSKRTPGEPVEGYHPPDTTDRQTTLAESERGREHFRIIRTRVDSADLLYLRQEGHVRARLTYPADSAVTATWLVP